MQRKGLWAMRTGCGIQESTVGMVWAEVCPASKCILFPLSCNASPAGKGIMLSTCCVFPLQVAALLTRPPGMLSLLPPSCSSELLGPHSDSLPTWAAVTVAPGATTSAHLHVLCNSRLCPMFGTVSPGSRRQEELHVQGFYQRRCCPTGRGPRLGELSEAV